MRQRNRAAGRERGCCSQAMTNGIDGDTDRRCSSLPAGYAIQARHSGAQTPWRAGFVSRSEKTLFRLGVPRPDGSRSAWGPEDMHTMSERKRNICPASGFLGLPRLLVSLFWSGEGIGWTCPCLVDLGVLTSVERSGKLEPKLRSPARLYIL